ncbi:FtsH protease activity modulator HflK [Marinospirillum sp.]|uniref:FtsH protease activity modulator HflK n=1 Tax=Marinospirillum sp. TaxID=2183934 RepID=UPI003A866A0B
MAWNEPGGNGNQHDPWGSGGRKPDRNSGQQKGPNQGPPDLDEALKKFQDKLGGVFGGSGGGSGQQKPSRFGGFGLTLLAGVLVLAIWVASGFYLVDEAERGVVMRLGKYHDTVNPGLRWNPPLIDSVTKVNVTRIRSQSQRATMLTRDENLVQVAVSIQYLVENPKDFIINVRDPERSLEFALDSSLRHEVGTTNLTAILTEGREVLATGLFDRMQRYLNNENLGLGIRLQTVNIEGTSAPDEVQSAFDDVIRAREDRERSINQANAYAQSILPEAQGRAERIRQEAEAYLESVVARAEGESSRFVALLNEYSQAPEITRERLYIEAIQAVLSNSSKVLLDTDEGSNNMLYLPLDRLGQSSAAPRSASAPRTQLQDQDLELLTDRVLERARERQSTGNTTRREGR